MGKLTISMAIFNSFLYVHQRVSIFQILSLVAPSCAVLSCDSRVCSPSPQFAARTPMKSIEIVPRKPQHSTRSVGTTNMLRKLWNYLRSDPLTNDSVIVSDISSGSKYMAYIYYYICVCIYIYIIYVYIPSFHGFSLENPAPTHSNSTFPSINKPRLPATRPDRAM